jgi:hypothetical protein
MQVLSKKRRSSCQDVRSSRGSPGRVYLLWALEERTSWPLCQERNLSPISGAMAIGHTKTRSCDFYQ